MNTKERNVDLAETSFLITSHRLLYIQYIIIIIILQLCVYFFV